MNKPRKRNKPIDRGSQLYKTQRARFKAECKARQARCTGWPGACGGPIDYSAAPQTSQAWELCHVIPASVRPDLAYDA